MSTVYSPGWGRPVVLGSAQSDLVRVLERIAAADRRSWHELPTMRELGDPGVTSRTLHRLHALGVIALEARRGRYGGVRFTFRVRRWKWSAPARRALAFARMKVRSVADAVRDFLAGRLARQLELTIPTGPPATEKASTGPSSFVLGMAAAGFAGFSR